MLKGSSFQNNSSFLNVGLKILSGSMTLNDKNKTIIAYATPSCILFIDFDSNEVTNLIVLENSIYSIIPQIVELEHMDSNYVMRREKILKIRHF